MFMNNAIIGTHFLTKTRLFIKNISWDRFINTLFKYGEIYCKLLLVISFIATYVACVMYQSIDSTVSQLNLEDAIYEYDLQPIGFLLVSAMIFVCCNILYFLHLAVSNIREHSTVRNLLVITSTIVCISYIYSLIPIIGYYFGDNLLNTGQDLDILYKFVTIMGCKYWEIISPLITAYCVFLFTMWFVVIANKNGGDKEWQ